MDNFYTCTPRQLKNILATVLGAGLVPFIQSDPGMGKSSIVQQLAKEYGLKVIDHRLSTSAPEDLSGLPRFDANGKAFMAPFADIFPTEDMEIPKGYNGYLLFLDEFNSARKETAAAAYKLILDRMVGQYRLHEKVLIVCAGNLSTSRAITNVMSTAMQSRLVHLELALSFDDWLNDVALKEGYDPRIIAYLSQYPNELMDFRPDHQEKTFCSPRTWEFTNRLIQGKPITDLTTIMLAGTITSGSAVKFVQFTEVFDSLPPISVILANPTTVPVPEDASTKWAIISMLMDKLKDDTFEKITDYVNRFSADFRVLYFRSVIMRQPHLQQHPVFRKSAGDLARYLF